VEQVPQQSNEVDKNYEAFLAILPKILCTHNGSFALLHEGEVQGFFDSSIDAYLEGIEKIGVGNFSIQQVTTESDNLGFYSYTGYPGQA
jgi:hypothetical protein